MIALLAATASPQAETPPRAAAVRQASASVRILSGARISREEVPATANARLVQVREPDGERKVVRLIEFP